MAKKRKSGQGSARELLEKNPGMSTAEVVKKLGCSKSAVYNARALIKKAKPSGAVRLTAPRMETQGPEEIALTPAVIISAVNLLKAAGGLRAAAKALESADWICKNAN